MPVLALHGFTGVGADFAPFAELCDHGPWHCPNLPGHGPEPQLDCTPEATIEQINVEATIQSLPSKPKHESDRIVASTKRILLGYSAGARAALLHACKYPTAWDALILISPNPGIEDDSERAERRAVDEKLAQRIEEEGVAAFIDFWQSTPMIRSQKNIRPDWREAMQLNREQHTAEGLATSLRQFGQGHCPNLWPELHKLTMPVLLITGTEDIKYTRIAERMFDCLPDVIRETLDDCGHMPQLEDPEICADIIGDFLNEIA